MPSGTIEEVGMAVWRYGGFISLTGVLKNLIARVYVCSRCTATFTFFHNIIPTLADISHEVFGHIGRRRLGRVRPFPLSPYLQKSWRNKNKPVHPEVSHSWRQVHNLIWNLHVSCSVSCFSRLLKYGRLFVTWAATSSGPDGRVQVHRGWRGRKSAQILQTE